jgi:cytochrome c oxidase assembly factor 3
MYSYHVHLSIESTPEDFGKKLIAYLDSFNSTYYGRDYRAGAALLRARRPYLVKNALTGLGLCGFCIGVCTLSFRIFRFRQNKKLPFQRVALFSLLFSDRVLHSDAFTIRAVGQEDFSDVVVPDVPAASKQQPN